MSVVCSPYISRLFAVYSPYIRCICPPHIRHKSAVCPSYLTSHWHYPEFFITKLDYLYSSTNFIYVDDKKGGGGFQISDVRGGGKALRTFVDKGGVV